MVDKIAEMTLTEFIRLYDKHGPFEIIDGKQVALSPNLPRHGITGCAVFRLLDRHVLAGQLGEVFYEMPYVRARQFRWVKGSRVPDIMFYDKSEVAEKVRRYIADGVKLILILDPAQKTVALHHTGVPTKLKFRGVPRTGAEPDKVLSEPDVLEGSDVLPQFSIPVKALFG